MNYRDEDRLELIVELIGHLNRRLDGMSRDRFLADEDEIDLTAYRLSIIGESCNKLSEEIRNRHIHIDWSAIYAMRNVIAHDYNGIDAKLVWKTLGEDLSTLAAVCRAELDG
ncbi:MAG: HepT-like ribonuclease domain-containing protein [Novosphingobium sp.]